MGRIAEGEVVLLDREDVSEVGGELDRDVEGDLGVREVHDDEVVLQVVGHEALEADQQVLGVPPARRPVAQEERRSEVLDLARRDRPG